MVDWTKTRTQTYEYYIVDPGTWKDVKQITTVKSSSITRDSSNETLGSASITVNESLGECYIRIYLVTVQNGVKEKHPLGTYLVQSPSMSFDGKIKSYSLDAYTPLIELKEKQPPIGYYLPKDTTNIMNQAYMLVRENTRATVTKAENEEMLGFNFVAESNETWLSFISDLISNAKYSLDLDEMGRILFSPKQDLASLQPVWTFDDDNSSILYADLSMENDLYNIPNAIEVVYSNTSSNHTVRVVNDDPNSPVSTVSRGREILKRVTNPDLPGVPTERQLQEYAENLLREASTFESTVSYKHGYCPVRVGDCVRLNYTRAGLKGVKAKVISQTIKCEADCEVSEKAIFTTKLWR